MKGIPVWWGISHFNHFHFRSDLKKKEKKKSRIANWKYLQ